MALITLSNGGQVECQPGETLLQALERSPWALHQACAGQGNCGLCRVKTQSQQPLDPLETATLGPHLLAQGFRLACRLRPQTDLSVQLGVLRPTSTWAPLSLPPQPVPPGEGVGAVLDLGTSNLTLGLWGFTQQRLLGAATCPNPQGRWGRDVLSRLAHAAGSPQAAEAMQQAVVGQVAKGLHSLLEQSGTPAELTGMLVVGNSVMISLLSRCNQEQLLDPHTWETRLTWPAQGDWQAAWGLAERAHLLLLPPLAGFVGSDLAAGLWASGILQQKTPALWIDFGTNSEVALWDGNKLWITSAPGGPAFEGIGMRYGMGAIPGAVVRLNLKPDGTWEAQGLGPGPWLGFCGAAYVDLFAQLLQIGLLQPNGRLAPGGDPYLLQAGAEEFLISSKEVDLFQQAKAATATGVELLCSRAGLGLHDLGQVVISGAFGQGLNLPRAIALGLLPRLPVSRMWQMPHAPLLGGMQLLASPGARMQLAQTLAQAAVLNLSLQPEFGDLFFRHLYLRPFDQAN